METAYQNNFKMYKAYQNVRSSFSFDMCLSTCSRYSVRNVATVASQTEYRDLWGTANLVFQFLPQPFKLSAELTLQLHIDEFSKPSPLRGKEVLNVRCHAEVGASTGAPSYH